MKTFGAKANTWTWQQVEAILSSLDRPEIIRLNYSGESASYPWLIQAIGKAKTMTGAHTEMVTSLVSMPVETLRQLAGSGIDRISISLHTLNRESFPFLYGGGSLDSFERRLAMLLERTRQASRPPIIDFAAVAIRSNVHELADIASMAAAQGSTLP